VRVLGDEFNNDEGTIIIDLQAGLPESNGKSVIFLSNNGSGNDSIKLRLLADNDTIDLYCIKDGSTTADTGGPSIPYSGKLGVTYSKTSGYIFAGNGSIRATVTGTNLIPDMNRLEFSGDLSKYKSIVYMPKASTEAELITLTGGN